jgi:precorrin-8X/cobalt-precorrin-8 methylmutase
LFLIKSACSMEKTGVIVLAHGSRGNKGAAEITQILRRVSCGIEAFLPEGVQVIGAALQFNHPGLEEAVESLMRQNVRQVVIAPYFLFSGRHITEDIPELIQRFKSVYPDVRFLLAENLGFHQCFVDIMVKRIKAVAPELMPGGRISSGSPEAIERRSMDIVAKLLPPLDLSEGERAVVKRIVHACGDPSIASLVKFHPQAVTAGISAIRAGKAIYTDTKMVAVGINNRLAKDFGCSIGCALDEPDVIEQAELSGITRAEALIHHLGKRLNGAVVAIGNAPTALLALNKMIAMDGIQPALVVGMPVGFVNAAESKIELVKGQVPYITIEGNRGGSATAVATVNALLKLTGSSQV